MKGQRFKAISTANPVAAVRGQAFLTRHGRPRTEDLREGKSDGGRRGWWEITAADGYKLRCEWVRGGTDEQLRFSEIEPGAEH